MGCAASTPFPSTPITNQPLPKQHDHKTGRSSTPTREELPKNVKSSPTSKDNIDSHKEPGNIGTGLETYETAKTNSEVVGDDMREIHQVGEIKSTAIDSEQAHSSISQINSEVDLSRCEKCSDEPDNIKGFESGPGSTSAVHTHREADDNLDEANVDGMMHHKAKTKDGSENRDGDFEQSQAQNSASEKNVIEEKDIINTNESTWAELGRGSPIQRSGQEILDKNPGQTVNEQDTIAKSGQESLDKNPGQTVNEQDTIAKAEQESLDKNQGQTVNGRDTIAKSGQESSDKNPSQTVNNQDTIAKSVDESSIPCIPLSDPRHDGGTVKVQTIEDLKLNLLRGNVNVQCPRTAKIVRVFLSSTFTDTKNERDLLLDDAYTRMKKKCKAKGYEFQLVDMRWGVVQSIDNSHMTGEMCINEIEQCQKLSTGPNFVTLLSHKYGYFAYPRIIEKTKFEKLAEFISSEKSENSSESDLDLIKKWYILDENSTPPHYVLQAISTYFPDFMSSDKDVYKGTKRNWNKTCDRIVNILIDAAKQAFQDERFIIGVTEFEIQQGILENDKRADTCLWLKRQIKGLEEEVGKKHKNKYIDSIDGSDWAERNKKLMTHLVDELTEKLPKENVIPFSISWKPEAIDPIAYDEHKEYLGEFCFEFEEKVMKQFKEALKGSKVKELGDKLLEEIAQHTRLCQEKCRDFYGRAKELKKLKKCVRDVNRTILVHGVSGSGKTSLMAALTKECWSWFGETAVIITRFVGATPESSRVGTLLASIIRQVCQAYGKSMDIPTEYDKLCEAFKQSIKSATPDKKLFIFLDSFEQLDPLEEAMNFKWIPDPLGDNVKMVISTTTADSIFPKLKTSLGKSPLIEIKAFTLEDATKTFEEWFSGKRTLTDIQMKIMKTALDACCLPLFLRLTFDEVYKWTSYMPVRESVLQHTIEEAIGAFFSHIEQTHGRKLVAHALGYLTLAKRGLSESELEDILSCVDEVLDELYVYWEPPVRRLPPLILVRLRSELDRYIAQREVEGTPVMLWNHHHFREVSQKRYCSDENFRQDIYQGLADFFAGTWAGDNKKPYKKKNKEGSVEDVAAKRKVAEQPLFFDDKCNFRKVNNLPWCLIATGDSEKLASECLCNLDFLLAKLEHVGIRFLLDDFVDAVEKFKNEEDFKQIKLVLQVSQRALQNDSNQLPAQLIARLRLSDGNNTASTKLKDLLEKCHKAPFPVLVSSDTQLEVSEMGLTHSLPAHTSQVVGFDLSKSGDTAITFCCDGQLKVWDIRRGQLVRSVDVPLDAFDHNTPKPNKCLLAYNDQIVVVVTEANLLLYDVNTGRNVETFSFQENHLDDPAVCVGGDAQGNELVSNAYIGVFSNSVWNLYNAKTLKKSQNRDIGSLERGRLGLESLCAGSSRFMAVTDEAHFYLRSFSIRDKLARTRRVFPIFNIPNNPDALGYQIQCMTFTSDGMTIIVANMHENEILFLDAENLEEKRRFRGYADDSPTAYCVTGDGRYVLFPSKQNVVVRGLNDENYRRSIAKHSNNVVFAATSDFNLLVTLGEDGVLRLWNDLDLKEKAWTEAEAVKEGTQIRHMELFRTTSRYAICVEVSPTTRHLSVYNLYSGRVVRRATLGPSMINIEVTVLHEDDDNVTAVVKRSCGHLCEVDLHAMKVTKELNIKVPKSEDENGKTFSILTIEQEQHLIALHYSELRIDCLEVSTGKKSNLFTSDCEAIDNFMVCESQLLLVAEVEQVFTIVDIVKKTVKHTISPDSFTDDVDLLGISADGKCLVFSGTNDGNLRCWNIVRDEPFPELDIYNDDANKEQTNDVEVEHVSFLDKETVVCSFGSGTVRICTLPTGKTKELTAGHVGEVTFSTKERSDMFLSYGSDAQDKTMVLWSKNGTEYKRVASYTSDYPLEHVVLSRDGTFVISCTVKPANVVTWHIEGKREYRSSQLHETNERELFRGTDLTLTLDLTCDKDSDVGSIDFLGDDDDRNRLVKTPDSLD